jgi:excisionase family DNA binding protein
MGWREAVEYTGLSESTLRRLAREGKIRTFQSIAGRTLLSRSDLDSYIESTQITHESESCGNEM